MIKLELLTKFSVNDITTEPDVRAKFGPLIKNEETIHLAYKSTRDRVVFTDSAIITMDVQGITGSKKEYRVFPYSKISSFSVETAGTFDGDSDFKIWVSGVGVFEIKFHKKLNIQEVGSFLMSKVG